MPKSLRSKIKHLAYKGELNERERDRILNALDREVKWIPCSKRLPEEDGMYLLFGKITDEDENYIFVGEYYAWMEKFGIWQERLNIGTRDLSSDFYEYESVIAWMSLPQPYKAESEDEE